MARWRWWDVGLDGGGRMFYKTYVRKEAASCCSPLFSRLSWFSPACTCSASSGAATCWATI